MISLKIIRNHHHFSSFRLNDITQFLKFMHLSSISRLSFSRSLQSSHTAYEPLSRTLRSVISVGATKNNRVAAESAQLNEKLRDLDEDMIDRPTKLEIEVQNLNMNNSREKVITLLTEKKEKRSLCPSFSPWENEQSESKPMLKLEKELGSVPVGRIAYGVEDPTVRKELSSDMKMLAEHLYEKGYFKNVNFIPKNGFDPSRFEVSYTREFLKFAAMNFAKDHPEIAGWLSAGILKKVVTFGCPSLGRHAVSSAKRMRKFYKIDERKVCQTCTLKKFCSYPNKSYKKPSTKLHMANIMKVLVLYAMETVPRELVVPEEVKNSVSRLLKEVTSLSQDM